MSRFRFHSFEGRKYYPPVLRSKDVYITHSKMKNDYVRVDIPIFGKFQHPYIVMLLNNSVCIRKFGKKLLVPRKIMLSSGNEYDCNSPELIWQQMSLHD